MRPPLTVEGVVRLDGPGGPFTVRATARSVALEFSRLGALWRSRRDLRRLEALASRLPAAWRPPIQLEVAGREIATVHPRARGRRIAVRWGALFRSVFAG